MSLNLLKLEVGPWPMNSYIISCPETNKCAIIDPGADAKKILKAVDRFKVEYILITHGHADHVGALENIRKMTGAQVCAHSEDAAHFKIDTDLILFEGDEIEIGSYGVKIHHTPGHTEGQISYDLLDGRIIVGDTIFVGGPGKTFSSNGFTVTMETMQNIVFNWADETKFFPGHGPAGMIGIERPAFDRFVDSGWEKDLFGDVAWD